MLIFRTWTFLRVGNLCEKALLGNHVASSNISDLQETKQVPTSSVPKTLIYCQHVKDEANDLVTRYFIKPSDKVSINTRQRFIVNCVYCVNLYIQTFGFYGYQLNPFMETIIRLRARVQPNAHFSSIELE